MTSIRTVFMGTPHFALPTLQALFESPEIQLTGILTQPDRPAGRGNKLQPPPVKQLAIDLGMDCFQPLSLKDENVIPWLKQQQPDVIAVVAYGGFVPKAIRDLTMYGCVNLHPSLLPKYRGAAPMQWTLINGDTLTGNTTIILSKGWDDGDIIFQEIEAVRKDDSYDTLSVRLSNLGAQLIVKTLLALADGTAPRTPQPNEGVCYAPMLQNEDAQLDWNLPANTLHNKVRGLCSIPGAYTFYGDQRWKIFRTEIIDAPSNAEPGTILSTEFNTIRVAAQDQIIEILELQPAGKKRMIAAELLRGYPVQTGTQLR